MPSTIGRMSRWTPSRDTSGPWPPSRPAILSISSMNRIPDDCDALDGHAGHLVGDRPSRAARPAEGPSRASEIGAGAACVSVRRRAPASGPAGSRPSPRRPASSGSGRPGTCVRAPRSRRCEPRAPRREAARAASRAWRGTARGAASAGVGRARVSVAPRGGRSRSRSCSSTLRSALSRTAASLLAAHHVDRSLGEVADHGLDVAADVARPR